MKPSKVRLQRRALQKRKELRASALEAAAVDLVHAIWHPTQYTNAVSLQRDRRVALYDAAIAFAAAVDGEEQPEPESKVAPIKKAAQ
jgi:hypothetical protein